jgi:hypothetical protein
MDVSSIDSTVIPAVTLDAIAAAETNTAPVAPQINPAQPNNVASIVSFSPLAQLLAATVKFQTQQTNPQQIVPTPDSANANADSDFNQLAELTTLFVNAFNNFQTSSSSPFANQFDSGFNSALLTAIQDENTQSGSENIQSFISSLAAVGINFQPATNTLNPNQFQIDWGTLEAAFNANPAQTTALLSNAFQALGAIEENLILSQQGLTVTANEIIPGLYSNALASEINTNVLASQPLLAEEAVISALENNLLASQIAAIEAGTTTNAATNTATTPATNTQLASLEAISPVASANPAVPAAAVTNEPETDTAAIVATTPAAAVVVNSLVTNQTATQTDMDPIATDPMIAVALAAYRMSEATPAAPLNTQRNPASEDIADVEQVTKSEAVAANAQGGANADAHPHTANSATTPAHSAANPAAFVLPPVQIKVDVSI